MKVLLYQGGKRIVAKSGVGRALEHQARALETAGIPYTVCPKDEYDIVQLNTVLPDSLLMSLRARLKKKAVVYYGHSTREDFRNSFPGSNLLSGLFGRWIAHCYGSADVIITPTPYSKGLLESYPVKPRVIALSNGIDLKAFHRSEEGGRRFRAAYGLEPSDKVVIGVGHYMERKGILDFIRMAGRFPAYQFIWFGYTPDVLVTGKVRRAMAKSPANLRFPGYVGKERLMDAYSGSDLFFFPTLEETEGIVMLEAMAMEVPVLVRDIKVYEGWLRDGKEVYKGKSLEEFAVLLPGILEGRLADLTLEAYRAVHKNSIGTVGETLAGIYEGLVEKEAVYEGLNYKRLV